MTVAPSAASVSAVARPMPCVAPVTRQVFPLSSAIADLKVVVRYARLRPSIISYASNGTTQTGQMNAVDMSGREMPHQAS